MLTDEVVANAIPSQVFENPLPISLSVQSQILATLRKSSYRQIQQVTCDVIENRIVLHGVVDSFYLKQLTQSLLRRYSLDGWIIVNAIDVP